MIRKVVGCACYFIFYFQKVSFKVLNGFNFCFIKFVLLLNTLAYDELHVEFKAVSVGVINHTVFLAVIVQRVLLQKLHQRATLQ